MTGRWPLAAGAMAVALGVGRQESLPAGLSGTWTGRATIVVNWTRARAIDVCITIDSTGAVTGIVGDAQLVSGRVSRNRNWLERRIAIKTDFIVDASLVGSLLAEEDVTRDRLRLPFNPRGGELRGGIHTSGTARGGRDSGVFSAVVTLRRAGTMPVHPGRC